jgi:RHS repeat-associated protein
MGVGDSTGKTSSTLIDRYATTMQADFTYDCTPSFVHLCGFKASRYTGKERDAETGLDNFGARYYASTIGTANIGRWMSPDWASHPEAVPYASLSSPQTLNLYAYVGNNPLRQADLSTPSTRTSLDLTGKAHFDKATGGSIPTPHVHENPISIGPNGQTNLGSGTTRAATHADIDAAAAKLKGTP